MPGCVAAGCGGWLQASSGVIASPGYPHGVPRRRRCVWRIWAPADRRVTLTTTDWQLPADARYSYGHCRTGIMVSGTATAVQPDGAGGG